MVPILVPPLRERAEDIPLLVRLLHRSGWADMAACRAGGSVADAVRALQQRPWPGNVRELRNAVERLLILARREGSDRDRTWAGCSPRSIARRRRPRGTPTESGRAGSFEEFKSEAERAFLLSKLREYHWNVAETARALDMPRSNLYKKIERYGLTRESA